MEFSSVRIDPVHDNPGFYGAAGGQDQGVLQSNQSTPDQYSSTPDHSSTTSSSSASSPLFVAPPAEARPDRGSSGAGTVTVTVDGPGGRAKALKSLKESIPHAMKLRQLQSSERKHQKDGSSHKKGVRRLSKELYVIVSWYALLQSALFAAVAQTNMFTCEDWWGPAGIAIMVTLGTFMSALDKLRRMGQRQQQVLFFQARQNAVYDKIDLLQWRGSDCDLDSLEPHHELVPVPDPGLLFVSSAHGLLVLGFLLGFSALIIISCVRMLCAGPPCKCSR